MSGSQTPFARRSLGDLSRIAPDQRCHPRRGIRLLADAAERRHERAAPSDLATELVVAEPMRCLNRNPGAAQDRYRGGDWQTTRVSCTIARKVAAGDAPTSRIRRRCGVILAERWTQRAVVAGTGKAIDR